MNETETLGKKAKSVLSTIGWHILTPAESFVDWNQAVGLAFDFAGSSDAGVFGEGSRVRSEFIEIYASLIEMIRPMVSSYVGREWPVQAEPVLVFDRAEWIVVNVENLKNLLQPLSEDYWEALNSHISLSYPFGRNIVRKASEVSITSELGLLVGYLSRRVLAQYDFGLPTADGIVPPEMFYFVEPNIVRMEEKHSLDALALRMWIVLHEVTHSLQFKVFPWLRDYMNQMIREYLEIVDQAIKTFKNEADEGTSGFSWGAGWWKELLSPEHRELIRRIQALMSLIEGYSEHVMLNVGKTLPNYHAMSGFFEHRHKNRGVAEQILEKLLGFDLKVKQYALGEKFVAHIVEERGIEFMNRIWEQKEHLPAYSEIYMPSAWIKRMDELKGK